MIQANELRYSNWVLYNDKYWQINAIDGSADEVDLYNYDHELDIDIEEINPIPLTEDILLRCGFEKYQWQNAFFIKTCFGHLYIHLYNSKIITRFMSITNDSRGQKSFSLPFIGHRNSTEEIIYLHQLQNLIFSLTGEELTFDTNHVNQ